jgi:hypothetical protein
MLGTGRPQRSWANVPHECEGSPICRRFLGTLLSTASSASIQGSNACSRGASGTGGVIRRLSEKLPGIGRSRRHRP